jgi:Zn-dependent protease with chaperone function
VNVGRDGDAAGLARPRIGSPDADPNARHRLDATHAHIAVTQGLPDPAVAPAAADVAHELGHVKNLDVRLMTTLAALSAVA